MTTLRAVQSGTPAEMPQEGPARRHRGRAALIGGTAVLAIGAAGGGLYLWHHNNGKATATTTTSTLPTAEVIRTNMVNTADENGTLGFGDSRGRARRGTGRITWLPHEGAVLKRGDRAYGVDGHGVALFYGSTPFWRDLKTGVTKDYDVLELERNLKALGYADGVTVDQNFTAATARAVKKLQRDMGMSRTGTVSPADVVVQPGAVRVTKIEALLAGAAGGTVYTVSGTERVVTVNLAVTDAQSLTHRNAKVQVTLPGGKHVTGTVSEIGAVATADSSTSSDANAQTGEGTENATIAVTVTLPATSAASALDGAPVIVGFASSEHKNVLAVPIDALLAAADGSYTVEVVDANGAASSVPVKLGIFSGDNVEVTGSLSPGEKVRVPAS